MMFRLQSKRPNLHLLGLMPHMLRVQCNDPFGDPLKELGYSQGEKWRPPYVLGSCRSAPYVRQTRLLGCDNFERVNRTFAAQGNSESCLGRPAGVGGLTRLEECRTFPTSSILSRSLSGREFSS